MGMHEHQKGGRNEAPGRMRHHAGRFAEVEYADDVLGTLGRIWKYFAGERTLLIMLTVLVVSGALCMLAAPAFQSAAIDRIATGKLDAVLWKTISVMLVLYAVYSGTQYFQSWLSAKLGQRIIRRLRGELFAKLVDLPVKYLDTHSHGDVMSRMTNDIENVSGTVTMALPSLVSGALTIIGVASMMFWYCWQLALLSMVTVVLTVVATRLLSKLVRRFSRERQKLLGEMNGMVEERISAYTSVVACNRQERTVNEFCDTSDALTKAGIRTDVLGGVMGPVMNCIGNIGFVIIAACGGYFSLHGLITVGVISAFIVYARQFSRPVNELAMVYGQLQTAVAGAERVFRILDEVNEDMSGRELTDLHEPEIVFDSVNFSYVPGRKVISDFSLKVGRGQKVALVGSTGCGKTTVVNLLMRFYDIDSGVIHVAGEDLREIGRQSLRKHIAIVLQDTVLFSDTVRNNLKYAAEDADDQALLDAADMSRCRRFIEQLPDGLDTVLTNAGGNLSQGQRQLLAIARAYVADPDILILDEATSNVDTRTEKAIQDAVREVMSNRTSIVIAHRLSTIRDSDMIVVMDAGHIVECGTHEELLAASGKYYELYMTQFASGMAGE